MSHRDILRPQLRIDEGCVEHAYTDSEGYLTIGIGRLIDKRRGGRLRPDEIALMLENDIIDAETDARALFPSFERLSDARKAVLCNFCFNLGRQKASQFVKFRAAIEEEDFERASKEMLDSLWSRQVGIRATRLAKMIREG
jgi:lysozyme